MKPTAPSRITEMTDWIEETSIAACLGLMTLITFANVVARYVFNDNILWALELTVFLFAWLVNSAFTRLYWVSLRKFHICWPPLTNAFAPVSCNHSLRT